MAGRTVELTVAGKSCRVVTSATDDELERLTALVEEKLANVLQPGRPLTTRAMLLAAVALAHDVDEQRARADAIANRAKGAFTDLLQRVDTALENSDAASKQREGRRRRSSAPAPDEDTVTVKSKARGKRASHESSDMP